MLIRKTPPLSPEGIEEILAEMRAPPADTPERRATFERARAAKFLVEQMLSHSE
ncbi:MAG TPA: hypothetical protein VGB24_13650 [Longimicrobium sp.]|jgi:hypothetical protein|uniref:hypothetical protein n=1 Tax=Longimicrobium sp. TaxID=2029185 RepID=UPI002ED87510